MPAVLRTLLLTDLVDSTRLVASLGDLRAAEISARHDTEARALLEPWRGLEIDKTDGFLLLFSSPDDAVGYALAYHRMLAALASELQLPLAARAGLHTGSVVLRENPPEQVRRGAKPLEVEGVAKPLAARVMGLAGARQTLLTADTARALGPHEHRLVCHGHWRMKGVTEPQELFEIGDPEAPFVPPEDVAKVYCVVQRDGVWVPRREIPHRLPPDERLLPGRRAVLEQLREALDEARLVSLVGPPELGARNLALRYAHGFLGDWPGGAWWLGPGDPDPEPAAHSLVVLEEPGAARVARLLQHHHVLAATKRPLELPGERSIPLEPYPPLDERPDHPARQLAEVVGVPGLPDEHLAELVRLLGGAPRYLRRALSRVARPSDERPFRGLASFQPEHAELFFGREQEVVRLAQRVRDHGLVTVTGASGVGKSSLLRAGLARELPGWTILLMRPGSDPMAALERTLGDSSGPRVLVVDQAEELVTLSRAEDRLPFGEALVGLAEAGEVRVALSLRGDFFTRLAEVAPLQGHYTRCVEVITAPSLEARVRTLVLPAAHFGYRFEDDQLPRRMAAAVADEPAALALLQFCADQLWQRRDQTRHLLTRAAYEAAGGVEGALAAHADRVVLGLTAPEQAEARRMLLRLVTADHTRAPRPRGELLETARDAELGTVVLDRLIEGRLLSVSVDEGGQAQVELVHEALLRHWHRLADWLGEDLEGQRHLRALAEATRAWERRRRTEDLLWRGAVLQEFQLWRSRAEPRLAVAEDAFVAASDARERRARRLRRTLVASAFTVLSVGLVSLAVSLERAERATAEASLSALIANAQAQLGAGADAVAIRLALAAWEREPATPRTRTLLHQVLAGRSELEILRLPEGVRSLQLASTGDRFSTKLNEEYTLFDGEMEDLAVLHPLVGTFLHDMSPEGGSLLTAGGNNPLRVYDTLDGSLRFAPEGHLAHWMYWGEDGQTLATHVEEGDGVKWRFYGLDGRELGDPLMAPMGAAKWAPDGERLAIAHDHATWTELVVYRFEDGEREELWSQDVDVGKRMTLAWHPDGDELLLVSPRLGLRRFDAGGEPLPELDEEVLFALYTPMGELLGADADDRISDLSVDPPLPYEEPPECTLKNVRMAPDGRHLVGACTSGVAWAWSRDGKLRTRLDGHATGIASWEFVDGGARLVTFGRDGTVRTWSLDGDARVTLDVPDWGRACSWNASGTAFVVDNNWGDMALFGRDGRRLVGPTPGAPKITRNRPTDERPHGWNDAGTLLLSNVRGYTGPQIRRADGSIALPASDTGDQRIHFRKGAWLPGTDHFLWAGPENASILDEQGEVVQTWAANPWYVDVSWAWNAQGTRLAASHEDGRLALWSSSGELLAELHGPDDAIDADHEVVWHPSGDRLVQSAWVRHGAGKVHARPTRVWDLDGNPMPDEIEGFDRWSPDGRYRYTRTEAGLGVVDEAGTTTLLDGPGEAGSMAQGDGSSFLVRYQGGAEVLWTWDGREIADVSTRRGSTAAACWDPLGELVVLTTSEGEMRLVPLADDALLEHARRLAPQPLEEKLQQRYLR